MGIRSFLAFELPFGIRKILADTTSEMKGLFLGLRWVKLENLHLTLIFLGDFPSHRVDSAGESLEETCNVYYPFSIQLKGIGTFGGKRNPRVLWAGIDGDVERMGIFRDELQVKLEAFGIEKEERRFKPHLTLARFRKDWKPKTELQGVLSKFKNMSSQPYNLNELLFLKSELKPAGPIYTELKRLPLKGSV